MAGEGNSLSEGAMTDRMVVGGGASGNGVGEPLLNAMSFCSVCKEVSDNHHLHYGALCCFSCRAFFRRANQTVGKVYVCKQDGKCDVSKKNRKKCQKCRYEACLRVGMDPGLVLTEDQKKARFRKMLEKKTEMAPGTPGPGGGVTPSTGNEMSVVSGSIQMESPRRSAYHQQLRPSAPPTLEGIPLVTTVKVKPREDGVGAIKRRRTTPPTWPTGLAASATAGSRDPYGRPSHHQSAPLQHWPQDQKMQQYVPGSNGGSRNGNGHVAGSQDEEAEDIIGGHEVANLENLERLLTLGDLQTDTLQEVEATLNLIQGTKRTPDMPYYMQQQNPHPQQQLQLQMQQPQPPPPQQLYQQQQRLTQGFYSMHKPIVINSSSEYYYGGQTTGPFEPVCDIKQDEAEEDDDDDSSRGGRPQLLQLGPAPFLNDSSASNSDECNYSNSSFLTNLENYFASAGGEVGGGYNRGEEVSGPETESLRRIMADFDRAASTTLSQEADLVQTLLQFHCMAGPISKYDARRLITCLAETFRQFAVSQPAFLNLTAADQFRLLAITRPLFVHYILGQYFTCTSDGSAQLQWLLGEERLNGLNMTGAVAKSINEFNNEVGLFLSHSSARRYMATAVEGLSGLKVTPRHNGLVAALLLFSPRPSTLSQSAAGSFDNPDTIEGHERSLLKALCQCRYGRMLGLSKMASRILGNESLKVPFVDILHVLRDIFMEQVTSEEDKSQMNQVTGAPTATTPTKTSLSPTSTATSEEVASSSTSTISTSALQQLLMQDTTTTTTSKSGSGSTSDGSRSPAGTSSSPPTSRTKSSKSSANDLLKDCPDSPMTPEEEAWISSQLVKFNSSYREVSLGEEFVKEFVMFSYDVPLSKHFATRQYATLAERFKKILQVHPGFDELSEQDQMAIWKGGCAKAVACCSAKVACFQTGNEQLDFLFGDTDRQQWRDNYANLKVSKFKKIQMTDCNRVSSLLSSAEMLDYLRLVGSLGEVTTDEDIFKMLVLLSLFNGDDDDMPEATTKFVTNIRNGYIKMLRRKLRHDRRTFSKIVVSLADIDELARIMKKLEIDAEKLHHD